MSNTGAGLLCGPVRMRSEWPECSNLHFIPNRGSFLGMESAARARGSAWVGTWKGGRIQRLKDGRNRYVLRRMVGGVRYSLTLAARDEEEALGAFYAFRQAPLRFIADHKSVKVAKKRAGVKHGLRLDQALITALDRWLQQEGRSAKHRKNTRSYLTWWGRMPRVLDLDGDGLDRALGKLPGRKHRIIAFKTLGKFLTTTSSDDRPRLRPEENPARFLRVPKPRAARRRATAGPPWSEFTLVSSPTRRWTTRATLRWHNWPVTYFAFRCTWACITRKSPGLLRAPGRSNKLTIPLSKAWSRSHTKAGSSIAYPSTHADTQRLCVCTRRGG